MNTYMDIDLMDVELLDAWAVEMFGFAGIMMTSNSINTKEIYYISYGR